MNWIIILKKNFLSNLRRASSGTRVVTRLTIAAILREHEFSRSRRKQQEEKKENSNVIDFPLIKYIGLFDEKINLDVAIC
jgi:hypothetical protein